MLFRYLIVLLVTASLPLIPPLPIGIFSWCVAATISLAYVAFIMEFSGMRRPWIVAGIEAASMVFCTTAFVQHHMALKSQFFFVYYEHIMGYCFLAEIVAIIIGITNSGEFKRLLFVCNSYIFGGTDFKRHNTCS